MTRKAGRQRRITLLGLGCGLAVLLGLAWLSFVGLKAQQEHRDDARIARDNIRAIRTLFSYLQDAETSQRGYLLIHEPAYLAPYQTVLASLPDLLTKVDKLIVSDPEQKEQVRMVVALAGEKLTELKESLDLSQRSPAKALELMKTGRGRDVMDRIRSQVIQLENQWSLDMQRNETSEELARYRAHTTMLVGSLLAALFLAIGTILVLRNAEALEQADQIYAQSRVIDLAPIMIRTREGRILFWSEGLERMFGWSKTEAIGRIAHELLHTQFSQALAEVDSQLMTNGKWTGEILCDKRDGSIVAVATTWTLQRDRRGRSDAVVEAYTDVNDLRVAQEQLLASQEQFHFLADHMSQLAWMADSKGEIYWYNQRWYEYTGTTFEDVKEWGWQRVLHPDHVHRVVEKLRGCFISGELWEDTFPLRGKDGTYRWFLSRAVTMRDAEGEITRWLGTHTDFTERIQAEEVRSTLAAIVTASDDAMVSKDLDGTITSWNPAAEALFGYSAEEMIGQKITRLIPQERLEEETAIMRAIRAGRRIPPFESRRNRKDGSQVDVSVTISPVFDETGKPVGAAKIARNITSRIRAERALRESQAELARELAATKELYEMGLRISKTENLTDALQITLQSATHLLGADFGNVRLYDEVSGALRIVAHHGFSDEFLKTFERVEIGDDAACGRAIQSRTRIIIGDVTTDAAYEPYRAAAAAAGFRAVQSTPLFDHNGALLGVISTHFREPHAPQPRELHLLDLYIREAVDAILRARTSETIRLSEARFRLLAEVIPQLVWTGSSDGRFDFVSQQWLDYTGSTLEDNLGYGWTRFLHPDEVDAVGDAWRKTVTGETSGPFSIEYRLRRHDGVYRWHLARAQALRAMSNEALKWFGTTTDIEAQKQQEAHLATMNRSLEERGAALAAANAELESFSYSVSHDLRAPLRTMNGFAQALLEDYGPKLETDAVRYLTIISKGAQQMGLLIDDLLAFSRLSRQPFERKPISLSDLLDEVRFDTRADQEGRTIEWNVVPLPRCLGDRTTIKLVLANLVGNALKYTRARSVARIEIGWRPDDQQPRHCLVYVKDNGVGFDMRYAAKLFKVFQRLHRSEEFEGTGVGLATVQRIVRRHGGRVGAEGVVDGGATFYFTLEMLDGSDTHLR